MLSLATGAIEVLEKTKVPSWLPWRWRHVFADALFYDVSPAMVHPWEWVDAYLSGKPMPEGGVIIIPPGDTDGEADLEVFDVREYIEKAMLDIDTVVVAGCGSSRVGSIAFGRTVANALGRKVASIIAGYGMRDVMGEAMSGAMIFFPMNWVLQAWDGVLNRTLATGDHPWLGLKTFDFTYAVPEAATLHTLLLHHHCRIKTIVGHSKGNFAIAAALHALKFSLDTVSDAHELESKFGLSKREDPGVVAAGDKLDVFTFGCLVSLPDAFGAEGTHRYASHQYVGDADAVLGVFGSGPLKILSMYAAGKVMTTPSVVDEAIVAATPLGGTFGIPSSPLVGHNVVTRTPFHPGFFCHMPAEEILAAYRQAKGL